ncbi:hypothetical protein [Alistipes sp. ZOR0009]|uniref:hypothetical protein n=1 Tax=Alistipes sp. ZOR0009 TaxID=1339253 RepID=UPI00068F8E13|nr:hypothetical protein [Alistipes sp. ZOR0009]
MEQEKEKIPLQQMNDKIANRNSILKIIVVTVFSILLAYKIAISDSKFDFTQFDFSDLLSLILALFSVALSVAFYFKATDTSNKFYDNTYKFTKEISEILGRIEAGFGEKLKHLDEGYTGLVDKFDGSGKKTKNIDIETAKKELDTEKEKLEKEIKEKNQILTQLMTKANLSTKEREEYTKKISDKDKEISNLSSELDYMKRRLIETEHMKESEIVHSIPPHLREYLMKYIKMECDPADLLHDPHEYLMDRLSGRRIEHIIGPREARELQKFGVLNDSREFTFMGIELLKSLAKRYI